MVTADLDPDGDVTTQWSPVPSLPGTHYTCIDEGMPASEADWVGCIGSGMAYKIDTFNMEGLDISGGEVTSIAVKVWHESYLPVCGCVPFTVDINLGGWQGAKNYTQPQTPGALETQTWTGLSGDQADITGLQVKLTSGNLGTDTSGCLPVSDLTTVFMVYVTVTYTEGSTGWGHKFLGVPAANIATVNGVPIANIASIKGVAI